MRNHLGTRFNVWKRRQSWFWLVLSEHGNSGAIGTAATEAEAVGEACSSIEEMAAQRPSSTISPGPLGGKALVPALNRAYPCNSALSWMDWWMSVAHQVTDKLLTR
jgi:hypothetical protein